MSCLKPRVPAVINTDCFSHTTSSIKHWSFWWAGAFLRGYNGTLFINLTKQLFIFNDVSFIKVYFGNRTFKTTIVSCAFSFLSDLAKFSQNSEILVAENF